VEIPQQKPHKSTDGLTNASVLRNFFALTNIDNLLQTNDEIKQHKRLLALAVKRRDKQENKPLDL